MRRHARRAGMKTDRLIAAAPRRREFHTLDALRGLAAITVAAYHYPELIAPLHIGGAYLAVDLFFLMSGVVIAHAYGGRFDAGLRPNIFLRIRLARLWPMFLLGCLISIAGISAALLVGFYSRWTWIALWAALPNLLFLPALPIAERSLELYPLDFPGWSLLYELLINLACIYSWRWVRGGLLAFVIPLAAVAIVVVAFCYGALDGGAHWTEAPIAVARITFSFVLGVAMQHKAAWFPTFRLPPWIALAGAVTLLVVPVPWEWRAAYDISCVLVGFPIIVWIALHSEPRGKTNWCTFLGLISYPLYTIHIPAKLFLIAASRGLIGVQPSALAPWAGIGTLVTLVAASWLAATYLDPPLRAWTDRVLVKEGKRGEPRLTVP